MGRGGVAVLRKPRLTKQEGDGRQGSKVPDRPYVGRTCLSTMLLVLLRLPRVLFVVLRFSCPFLSILVVFCLSYCIVLFCLSHLRGGARHFFLFILFIIFVPLFLSFFSLIALSTLLTALQCSISVSSFCDYRAYISLGGRIGTDTGCAECRRVERTV